MQLGHFVDAGSLSRHVVDFEAVVVAWSGHGH